MNTLTLKYHILLFSSPKQEVTFFLSFLLMKVHIKLSFDRIKLIELKTPLYDLRET